MGLAEEPGDVLVLAKKGSDWLEVPGVLKDLGPREITFEWRGRTGTFKRDEVPAVRFAEVARKAPGRAATVVGRDGSAIGVASLALDADAAAVTIPGVGKRRIPRDRIALIRFASGRVVKLSSLKPAAVAEHGVFATFPHRLNESAGGGPIRLGGRTYEDGLGLHSFCELTYELDGAYGTFVAVAGIDDAVRPRGEALLTFLADGKALAGPLLLTGRPDRQRKGIPQTPVRLDVSGVKRLTIRVDFGPNGLDVGDHVDLAAARLIR